MRQISRQDMRDWGTCWDEEMLAAGWPTEEHAWDAEWILDHPIHNADEKFWVLLRPAVVTDENLRLFVADCIDHIKHLSFEPEWMEFAIETIRAQSEDVIGSGTNADIASVYGKITNNIAEQAAAWGCTQQAWKAARRVVDEAQKAVLEAGDNDARRAERNWQLNKLRGYL